MARAFRGSGVRRDGLGALAIRRAVRADRLAALRFDARACSARGPEWSRCSRSTSRRSSSPRPAVGSCRTGRCSPRLAAAALALARLFFERAASRREAWPLWLAVGAAFGLAGLSKYSAALTALGLVALYRVDRRASGAGSRDPAPYVAAALALGDRGAGRSSGTPSTAGSRSAFRAARGAPDSHRRGPLAGAGHGARRDRLSARPGFSRPRRRGSRRLSRARRGDERGCSCFASPRRRSWSSP